MKKIFFALFFIPTLIFAQKKPLDHSVYDDWQSIGEYTASDNGKWIAYTINPQEGNGDLIVISADKKYSVDIPRGYNVKFTNDNRYAVFKIKPLFQDTRQAEMKKKKADEMPKDSLGILELGKDSIRKFDLVKSYILPEKGSGWIAIQKEQETGKSGPKSNKVVDSLKKEIDSLKKVVLGLHTPASGEKITDTAIADSTETNTNTAGSTLILLNPSSQKEIEIANTSSFILDKQGKYAAVFLKDLTKDTLNKNGVLLFSFETEKGDTILSAINDVKQFGFSETGLLLAFVAQTDTNKNALQKYYHLYLHRSGAAKAEMIATQSVAGIPERYMISQYGDIRFSKDETRLFFSTVPIPLPKDTATKDIDKVDVDIWHYKDDYLQPQQLKNLKRDKERSYLALYDLNTRKIIQLGDKGLPEVLTPDEGNADYFVATTDTGRRIASQWTGRTLQDIYRINARTGEKQLIKKNLSGFRYVTPRGKYVFWYDHIAENYFTYNGKEIINISANVPASIVDEENDVPDYPRPYGVLGWLKDDEAVLIYDRYDVWKLDPEGKKAPLNITKNGRANQDVYRYNRTNPDDRYLKKGQLMVFNIFNRVNKSARLAKTQLSDHLDFKPISEGDYSYSLPVKSKDAALLLYTKQNYVHPPDLYSFDGKEEQLTTINPQQNEYNWGTAELFHWTTFGGKESTGIVYKPENFDPDKKYPAIIYFYEKLSDGLNTYIPPTPTPSRLNISFFVGRGYIVFAPDISYTIGHPGESAYDYIVSGAKALARNKWIDTDNIGIQGQSWGGYQVAYLITRTSMFKAAWSGAPVSNMFSAYGGIRWGSGMNRQFQYEHTQSRIGATIWERPDLYIENSPLFHLSEVITPMVIMANDNDGAVPWYQGIELFTAMRRLNKKVWLLNYNGDEHNLMQRKNRKDISIREQQFFDWLLKGEKPPKWISEGVPAIDKGKDWGLEEE